MNQIEINKQRAQLLVTARNLLNEEYQKKRSEQFSKWQTESNHLWLSKGIILPYPSSFGYPTEEEIVAKALELYNNQNNGKPSGIELPKTDDAMTASVTAKLMEVSHNVKPVVMPEVPTITPWEQYLTPQLEPVEETESAVEDIVTKDEQALTEEQQIEEAKNNSKLRSLLAQFITMAKGLDAKKDEGITK